MFRGLKGRQVVLNTTIPGEAPFKGTVAHVGLFHVVLRDFRAILPDGREAPEAQGLARIRRRLITWIQEL